MNTLRPLVSACTALLLAAVMGAGCSYKAGYNVTYLPDPPAVEKRAGTILIYMTREEDQWVYKGKPTSFTGSATTLTLPLGSITREVSERVFSEHFSRVRSATSMDREAQYLVAVHPRVRNFEYAYNSLQNLGFAITPEVKMDLHVRAYDGQGKEIFEETYQSGEKEGDTYIASGSPAEKVNSVIHRCLYDLMSQAAADVKGALEK